MSALAAASPARFWLQMYEDSGRTLLPNWPGWRAVVTDSQGQQQWVNMPTEGQQTFLKDFMAGGTAGGLPDCPTTAAMPSCLLGCAAWTGSISCNMQA